jgi:hypothetical protein
MTASRSKYSAPLQMAGTKFGIDLAGLFEDAEGNVDMGGFVPEYTTRMTEKGRGNVMSYKAPKMPTTVSEFSLKPEAPGTSINVTLPGGPPAPPTPPKPVDTRRSLGSVAAEYGQSGLFGHADYFEAQKLGYSNEEIRNYLESNPNMVSGGNRPGQAGGLYEEIIRDNVNPQSAMSRGSQPAPAPEPSYQINTSAGQSADFFGDADYDAAKAAGKSDAEIKNFLDQNISGLLRGTNLPGAGGLYDRLRA